MNYLLSLISYVPKEDGSYLPTVGQGHAKVIGYTCDTTANAIPTRCVIYDFGSQNLRSENNVCIEIIYIRGLR